MARRRCTDLGHVKEKELQTARAFDAFQSSSIYEQLVEAAAAPEDNSDIYTNPHPHSRKTKDGTVYVSSETSEETSEDENAVLKDNTLQQAILDERPDIETGEEKEDSLPEEEDDLEPADYSSDVDEQQMIRRALARKDDAEIVSDFPMIKGKGGSEGRKLACVETRIGAYYDVDFRMVVEQASWTYIYHDSIQLLPRRCSKLVLPKGFIAGLGCMIHGTPDTDHTHKKVWVWCRKDERWEQSKMPVMTLLRLGLRPLTLAEWEQDVVPKDVELHKQTCQQTIS